MNESRVQIIDRKSKLWTIPIKIQRIILGITSLFIVMIVTLGALFRYILKMDLVGSADIILVVTMLMYFTGGAYASYLKNHINGEVIPSHIKNKKTRNIVLIVRSIITVVLSWIFTYWSFEMAKWSFLNGFKTSTFKISYAVPQSFVFIGLLFMSLYFTIYAIEDILNYRKDNYTDFLIDSEVIE